MLRARGGGGDANPRTGQRLLGGLREKGGLKKQKERYFIILIQVEGKKTLKIQGLTRRATFWVNEFPRSHYLYISIPDSKVNETYITFAYSYQEHCV